MYGGIRIHSAEDREPKTVEWIETYMDAGDVLYDVGANVGAYSLVAAANDITVYAFEPSITNFVVLLKNIVKNQFDSKIIPLNIPLADKSSLRFFNYYDLTAGTSNHAFGDSINYAGSEFDPVFKQLTMSLTIDELVFTHGVKMPNHLKIDVDGIELQILKGAKKVLRSNECKTVCIEVMEKFSDSVGINELLLECGFQKEDKMKTAVNTIYKKKANE